MKWLIFKDEFSVPNGFALSEDMTKYILDAAKRGLLTEKASKMLMVPDTRTGPRDASGLQSMKSVRKSECMTLGMAFPNAKPSVHAGCISAKPQSDA